MVHPYLRRRNDEEKWITRRRTETGVRARTLGVPFSGTGDGTGVVAAEYTPDEADKLRRAMAAWKRHGSLEPHRVRLTERMLAKRLPARLHRADLRADQRVRQLRFSRITRGEFCPAHLCQLLAETPRAGCICLCPDQQLADGLLQP